MKASALAILFSFGVVTLWANDPPEAVEQESDCPRPALSNSWRFLEIHDPSFENEPASNDISPQDVDAWGHDWNYSVSSGNDGITPLCGEKMLQFVGCDYENKPNRPSERSEIVQMIRLSDHLTQEELRLVRRGIAVVRGEVWVNRVYGDSETDTQFHFGFFAFPEVVAKYDGTLPGDLEEILEAQEISFLPSRRSTLTTDYDPKTWEPITVHYRLPDYTDYLVICVAAQENVHNDQEFQHHKEPIEFDGHYADNVSLAISFDQ